MNTHETPTLQALTRDPKRLGSRYAKRLREDGRLPCVIYGHGQPPAHISLDARETEYVLLHHAHLLNLAISDGEASPVSESCLVKDVQWDHLGKRILHLDLTRVDLSEQVEIEVALAFHGDPKAAQAEGALVDHPLQNLLVRCRADAIPEVIDVDVEHLTDEAPITAGELALPQGVALGVEPDTIIAQIVTVNARIDLDELEADAEAEAGEPEVISGKPAAGQSEDQPD